MDICRKVLLVASGLKKHAEKKKKKRLLGKLIVGAQSNFSSSSRDFVKFLTDFGGVFLLLCGFVRYLHMVVK